MAIKPGEYDYIVVGGGSAGALVACQLAQAGKLQVLLLESGARVSHRCTRLPALYPFLFSDRRFSHIAQTVPQPGLANRRVPLPSGRGLGGSSLINAMIWLPPHPADLQRWSVVSGGAWSLANMQHALESLYEDYREAGALQPAVDSCKHSHLSPSVRRFVRCSNSRMRRGDSRDQADVVSPYARTVRNGRRLTSWQVYRPKTHAGNLTVCRDVAVQRIVFDGEQASGVAMRGEESPVERVATARRGVILCAGALGSPILLQRSGVGPIDWLKEAEVQPIADSPRVGRELQDHLIFPVIAGLAHEAFPSRPTRELVRQAVLGGVGPLTSNIAEAGGFLGGSDTDSPAWFSFPEADPGRADQRASSEAPAVQWHVTPTHYLEYPGRELPTPAMSVGVTLLHPKSRGVVRLEKEGQVAIDPGYLLEKSDREEFVRAIQWTRRWLRDGAEELETVSELFPGAKRSEEGQVSNSLSRFATTLYHYVGTCAVGQEATAACGPDFRVRGCSGLYVCDASVLPSLPSGNTQVAVMMLAKMLIASLEDGQ